MSITLQTIQLPDDLRWDDEFKFSTVAQNKQRTLTGAFIVQESEKVKGRTIKLVGGEDSAWIDRGTLIQLQALVDTVDNDMVLNFHGTSYNVRFDRNNGESPLDAKPVIDCTDPDITAPYSMNLNLFTV